jgi:glycosyltransferase involved in cell wall biosynthesis
LATDGHGWTRMRVLHVIPSVAEMRGGPSFMVRTLAAGLAEVGVAADIATTDDNGGGRSGVELGVPVAGDGFTSWYFPRQSRFYTVSLPLGQWLTQRSGDYDLVHIHALFSYSSAAAAFAARRSGTPYIVRPLGTLNRWGMRNRRPRLKELSFRWVESRILKNAALVHFTSEQEREEAAELGVNGASAIIPNPVRIADEDCSMRGAFRARYPELRDKAVVLFLSRFDRKKGLDLLVPAFVRARRQFPGCALVLAGDGDPALVSELKTEIGRLGAANDVVWAGFLSGDEKRAALADADLFVLPSYSENFGIAAVEAMNAGVAVIVSDQTGIHREIVQAGAGVSVPCEVDALAGAMGWLLADAGRRGEMGRNGRELAREHFSVGAVVRRTVEAYEEVLAADERR